MIENRRRNLGRVFVELAVEHRDKRRGNKQLFAQSPSGIDNLLLGRATNSDNEQTGSRSLSNLLDEHFVD